MNFGDEVDKPPKPLDIASAMKRARENKELRQEHFLNKFTLQNNAGSKGGASSSIEPPSKMPKIQADLATTKAEKKALAEPRGFRS